MSSQEFGVGPAISEVQRSSRTLRWHCERWFRIVCSIYWAKNIVPFPLFLDGEVSRSSPVGTLEALRDLQAFAMTRSAALRLTKAIAKMELRVPGIISGGHGSGQCRAGFTGDDHPRAAHGSGQCKAGLAGDVSLNGVFDCGQCTDADLALQDYQGCLRGLEQKPAVFRDVQQSQARPVLAPHWQEHSRVHIAQEGHAELHTCLRTGTAHSMSPYHTIPYHKHHRWRLQK